MNGSETTRETMTVTVLRTSGEEEEHYGIPRGSIDDIYRLIGCELVDVVNLRDGRLMVVDDEGLIVGKPTNEAASALYRSLTGRPDTRIAGDVAIVADKDFT